jgi:hypothetical protein
MDELKQSGSPTRFSEFVSLRLYRTLLLAYPSDFRQHYSAEMVQTFRDCHRAAYARTRISGVTGLWLRTLFDLVHSASLERLENFGREGELMNNLRRQVVALVGCIAIIIAAFALQAYLRNHEVRSLILLNYVLDPMVVVGVVGNLIVFILAKATSFNAFRTAVWTFVVVSSVLLLTAVVLGMSVDPGFRFGPVLIGYVISLLFWVGVHWLWSRGHTEPQTA